MTNTTVFDILMLFSMAVGILTVFSIIGETLRARLPAHRSHPIVETYVTRVHSWWAMTILTSLALLVGPTGVIVMFAICSFAGLREFLTLTSKTKADHWSLIAVFYVILPLQYVLIALNMTALMAIMIPVYAFLMLPILSVLRGPTGNLLARISETQWALMICIYCASHVPALVTLDIEGYAGREVLLIAFLILVVQLADLTDYFAGRRFGRRKIVAEISPKTWEGVGIAAIAAMLIGAGLSWITPFGVFGAALMALMAFCVGTGGTLVLQAIKRDLGVKDWGHLIRGQGGFVDQLDSVLFAAPIFYHVTRHMWG